MNLFIDRHQELLKELLNEKVDFIIIGGYSVIYHGYMRTTGDVDIWLKPSNENKQKLLIVLSKLNTDKEIIEEIERIDFTKHFAIGVWEKPERVDFITHISLVKYEEADKEKIMVETDGLKIPFLHLNHLILSKINTGRPKDAADIDELQKIQQLKNKKK